MGPLLVVVFARPAVGDFAQLPNRARRMREICGNRSGSVVFHRANRNGASVGRLLNIKTILSGAASS